jgi:hypothetical protein
MNRYEPSVPHVAFGIAAVVMTAITIGVSVIMPAQVVSDGRVFMPAASKVTTLASTDVAAGSASIDVAAAHEAAGSSMVPCLAQIEPQASTPSKTVSRFHAHHRCCPAAQTRPHRHSMEWS